VRHLAQVEKAARLLSIVGRRSHSNNEDRSEELLRFSARIFERLGIWELENGRTDDAFAAISQAALTYCVGGYDANARVLMEAAIPIATTNKVTVAPGLMCTGLLLSGRLPELEDLLAQIVFSEGQFSTAKAKTEEEWVDLVGESLARLGDLLIAKSFCLILHYLRSGRQDLVNMALDCLDRSGTVYSLVGEHQSCHVSALMIPYCTRLIRDSPHALLAGNLPENAIDDSWKRYLRRLRIGKFPMIFLWKSQRKALEAGLLGSESLLISMPTSAGKTRTVELAIFDALKNNPDRVCVYVVPTRALAAEVEENVASRLGPMGLAVSVLYGGYDLSPLDEELLAQNRIFVLTPEKLDLLVRQSHEFAERICLIIIDEAQKIAAPSASPRCLRMELILSRILYLAAKNKARVLCLSAMISNREEFAAWIAGNSDNVIHTEWEPAFKRYGVFEWRGNSGQIRYPPIVNEFPVEDFYVPLLLKRQELSNEDRGRLEVAARVGIFYAKTGPTLVFTTTKRFVENIADRITTLLEKDPPAMITARKQIALRCAQVLGDGHKLVRAIDLGFCYHHADLPRSVRRILENGIREGSLSLIVSTTTLAQGVNLPIKNVVVHSLFLGGAVSTVQFWNAAGRAGRAGYETEGHIVFCFYPDFQRVAEAELEKSQSFIATGMRTLIDSRLPSASTAAEFVEHWALASTSQFRSAGETYESWGSRRRVNAEKNTRDILTILDSQLLAWAIEESVDEITDEVVEKWVNRTLFAVQTIDIPEQTKRFTAGLAKRARAVRRQVPDEAERKLFNRTGLSVSSNKAISSLAQEIKPLIPEMEGLDRLPRDFWLKIHSSLKDISEISGLGEIEGELLADWVEGKEYGSLANEYYHGDIERAVGSIEEATFSFPWGSHAIIQHLVAALGNEAIPRLVRFMPSLVHHGVPTLAAVYAINLGVSDRRLAVRIGDAYLSEHDSVGFAALKEWLQGIGYSEWGKMLKGENPDVVNECYQLVSAKKEKIKKADAVLEFNVSDVQEVEEADAEDLIVVRHGGDFVLCTFDYRRIGRLTGANLARLEQVDRRNRDVVVEEFSHSKKWASIRVL